MRLPCGIFSNYAFCSKTAMEAMCVNYGDGNKIQEADFYVTDAAQLESVINEVQSISSINWNNFIVTANDEVYSGTIEMGKIKLWPVTN